jgi:hypothetical protein
MAISRNGFYKNFNILIEITKQQQKRESCFIPYFYDNEKQKWKALSPVRWLNIQYSGMLNKQFDEFKFLEKPMNIYFSLARYANFPMFSWNRLIKQQEQGIWAKEFHKYIVGYDLLIETDSTDLKLSFKDTIKIKEFLDSYKLKYCIGFSGSKGCHILLPDEEFSHIKLPIYDVRGVFYDRVKLFKDINKRLKFVLNCLTLDESITDILRVCKTKYSLDCKSGLVAYPLTENWLYNFDKALVTPENILRQDNYKRGLLWRNDGVPLDERRRNTDRLIADLDIPLEKYI